MKKMEKYYMNRSTGEITENHRTAIEWYRNGDEVEIWVNGKFAAAWVM